MSADAASAASQFMYGVDEVRFAWTPSANATHGYLVSVMRGGSPLTALSWVTEPKATVVVSAGDRIAIAVQGVRRTGAGYEFSQYSPLSDVVQILPSPRFPVEGAWMLRCLDCPALSIRALADASAVFADVPALPVPWRIVGRAALTSVGPALIVWRNPITGEIALWDWQELAPIPGGSTYGPIPARVVAGADFNGDRIEELVLQRTDTAQLQLYALTAGGLTRVATLPAPSGASLVAVEDFTGDGKVDLLWHNPVLGTLDRQSVLRDPRIVVSLSSSSRVVTGAFAADADLVDTGDYDGDGETDLLWRYSDGRLLIAYLVDGRYSRYRTLAAIEGDANRDVVGSVDVDGGAGDEIALQHRTTKAISILLPTQPVAIARMGVLNPGNEWSVVDVRRREP